MMQKFTIEQRDALLKAIPEMHTVAVGKLTKEIETDDVANGAASLMLLSLPFLAGFVVEFSAWVEANTDDNKKEDINSEN